MLQLDGGRRYALAEGARRFENWESFVAGRIGLAAAVDYALAVGVPAIEARVTALVALLREQLGELPGVAVRDQGRRRCGIVTFDNADEAPDDLANISVSSQLNARLDLGARRLPALARAFVHCFHTEDEVGRFVDLVRGR